MQKRMAQRAARIKDLQAQLPKNDSLLTAANLRAKGLSTDMKPIDDDEFSVMTDESEIQFLENVLDIKIAKIQLESNFINQILGMQHPMDSAVQTFITLDFYNHDTKPTELTFGYEPDIDTVFSFKNNVDNFYLRHLEKESIKAELYILRGIGGAGKRSVKIAEAMLPLSPLLSKDSPQSQVMSWEGTFDEW